MNNETAELIERYVELVKGRDVFLELEVNAESPVVKIRGLTFWFIFAANGYFRACGSAEHVVRDKTEAFKYLEKYVEEETNEQKTTCCNCD